MAKAGILSNMGNFFIFMKVLCLGVDFCEKNKDVFLDFLFLSDRSLDEDIFIDYLETDLIFMFNLLSFCSWITLLVSLMYKFFLQTLWFE